MGRPTKDITGERFGRLTAIRESYKRNRVSYWLCECDCGESCTVRKPSLLNGNTRSCGCLLKEAVSERNRRRAALKSKDNKVYSNDV